MCKRCPLLAEAYNTLHTSSPYPAKFSTITYYSIRKCMSTPMTQIHHTNNTLHSYLYLTPNLIFPPQILNLANFELGAICADCLGYSAAVSVQWIISSISDICINLYTCVCVWVLKRRLNYFTIITFFLHLSPFL